MTIDDTTPTLTTLTFTPGATSLGSSPTLNETFVPSCRLKLSVSTSIISKALPKKLTYNGSFVVTSEAFTGSLNTMLYSIAPFSVVPRTTSSPRSLSFTAEYNTLKSELKLNSSSTSYPSSSKDNSPLNNLAILECVNNLIIESPKLNSSMT